MVLGARMTREPVRLKDAPGFLVNQVGRGYNVETQHLQAECVGEFADLDRILRDGAGFRRGGPVEGFYPMPMDEMMMEACHLEDGCIDVMP